MIKTFLIERRQRVSLGDVASSWVDITSGFPQRSVLGSLMYKYKYDLKDYKVQNHHGT